MKVFKIKYAIDRNSQVPNPYQYLMLNTDGLKPEELGLYKYQRFRFEGMPYDEKTWVAPPMDLMQPLRPAPDIWYLANSGAFGAGPKAFDCLSSFIVQAGQFLPLIFRQHTIQICNILESAECIDEDRSEWRIRPNGPTSLKRPFFIPDKIPASTLFKIPEIPADIYVWEETGEPDDEFKACVEINGLTGLMFEPVWSEEEGIIPYKRI
jgi:hypothetical protein